MRNDATARAPPLSVRNEHAPVAQPNPSHLHRTTSAPPTPNAADLPKAPRWRAHADSMDQMHHRAFSIADHGRHFLAPLGSFLGSGDVPASGTDAVEDDFDWWATAGANRDFMCNQTEVSPPQIEHPSIALLKKSMRTPTKPDETTPGSQPPATPGVERTANWADARTPIEEAMPPVPDVELREIGEGEVVLNQLMQLQNAYYNACATLVLGALLLLGYMNIRLVGTYFYALVAALLTGLVLRQPRFAVETLLEYDGGAVAGVGANRSTRQAYRMPEAADKSGRLFQLLGCCYALYFGYEFIVASPGLALELVTALLFVAAAARGLRVLAPVWKPQTEYVANSRIYESGRWWADPYQLVYTAETGGYSGLSEPLWPQSEAPAGSGFRALGGKMPLPLLADGDVRWRPASASLLQCPHLILGLPFYHGRVLLSRHREQLATAVVIGLVAIGSAVFAMYFVLQIFAEANTFRLAVTQPDPTMWPTLINVLGVSEEQVAEQLGNATETAQQAMVDYSRSLVGDADLAADIEKLIRTTMREFQLAEEQREQSQDQVGTPSDPVTFGRSEMKFEQVWAVISHSADIWKQAITLAKKLASQALSVLALIFRVLFSTIDYFFSFSLYISWVWVFVSAENDILKTVAGRLVADATVQGDLYTVAYFSVQVVLGGLARSFVFHASTAWLIFKIFHVSLVHIGALAAGLVALFPVGSPWMVIWSCPLYRWAANRWVFNHEWLYWLLIFIAHLKLDTATITHVHIARARYISASMAGQSILLAYYAFGVSGVVLGPLIVSVTVGIMKIIQRSVVEPLQQLSEISPTEYSNMIQKRAVARTTPTKSPLFGASPRRA
eukprot:SAG11_NODE_637_length_8033_cov_4.585707_2_plen_844_part_00